MNLYNFKNLIKKYTVPFTLQIPDDMVNPGNYDEDLGKFVEPIRNYALPIDAEGALIPLSQRAIYNSGGRLTEADRTLYSFDSAIPMKSLIRYKELAYSVEAKVPYEQYADFTQYTLKAVDAFHD